MAILFTAQPKTSKLYPIYSGHSVWVNNENIKISLSRNTSPSGYNHFSEGILFKVYAIADLSAIETLKNNIKANLEAKGILPIKGPRLYLDWYDYKKSGLTEIILSSVIYEEIDKLIKQDYEIEVNQPPKIIKKVIQPLA
ncbi:MAG: hypothetical protein JXR36_09025 [Bacteroidales bacterium]|nr:hypothetical protein [Bacteroidales bacterium]